MRSIASIAIAFLLALSVGLLVSCGESSQDQNSQSGNESGSPDSSASATADKDGAAERYSAYYAKCQEYSTIHGEPSTVEYGLHLKVASGLSVVRLVDFDGDGTEELLVGYGIPDVESGLEVWSYRDGAMTREYEGSLSTHTTNGFLPYAEVVRRADADGYALNVEICIGSSPRAYFFELCGYTPDGTFDVFAKQAMMIKYDTAYYICPNNDNLAWTPEEWREVSEAEYEESFAAIAGERLFHLHLFEEERSDIVVCDLDSHLDDTMEGTRETIEFLAQHAS